MKTIRLVLLATLLAGCEAGGTSGDAAPEGPAGATGAGLPDAEKRQPGEEVPPL